MFGWGGRPSRNLPTVDYNEDSSDEDLPFVSPKRPSVTRAGSPELLAVPQLSDNVDEDLEQVSQTLKNIGHCSILCSIDIPNHTMQQSIEYLIFCYQEIMLPDKRNSIQKI